MAEHNRYTKTATSLGWFSVPEDPKIVLQDLKLTLKAVVAFNYTMHADMLHSPKHWWRIKLGGLVDLKAPPN